MTEKPVLVFTTYKFRKGINLSIRRGVRMASGLSVGDTISLQPRDGEGMREATITSLKIKRFRDIREEELKAEHDPQCQNYMALLTTMKRLYDDFDETEIVSMIYFNVEE